MTLFFQSSCPIPGQEIQTANRNKSRAEFEAQFREDFSLQELSEKMDVSWGLYSGLSSEEGRATKWTAIVLYSVKYKQCSASMFCISVLIILNICSRARLNTYSFNRKKKGTRFSDGEFGCFPCTGTWSSYQAPQTCCVDQVTRYQNKAKFQRANTIWKIPRNLNIHSRQNKILEVCRCVRWLVHFMRVSFVSYLSDCAREG